MTNDDHLCNLAKNTLLHRVLNIRRCSVFSFRDWICVKLLHLMEECYFCRWLSSLQSAESYLDCRLTRALPPSSVKL